MQLGAAHDDAVAAPLDNAHIEIGIVLFVRPALAVPLGIGDHFRRAQVVVPAIAVHALDVFGVAGIDQSDLVLDAHQRHVDARDRGPDRGVSQKLDPLGEILRTARDLIDAMRVAAVLALEASQCAELGIVILIILRRVGDRHAESGMLGDVGDLLAVPEGDAPIVQARDIVRRPFQSHRRSSSNPRRC